MIKSIQIFLVRFFPQIITGSFLVLGVLGILHHTMWFAEMQGWLIARSSHSFSELLFNLRYESHPPLWYLLLFVLKQFFSNPVAMQFFHLAIASINAWLVFKYSPFSKLQKFFLVFSFFLFFEYMLIARSYTLGVLFVFLFCVLVARPQRNYLLLTLILALLCLTSIFGLILAVTFAVFLVLEFFETPKAQRNYSFQIFLSVILFIAALGASLSSMLPSQDSGYVKDLFVGHGEQRFLRTMQAAYFPNSFGLLYAWDLNQVMEILAVLLLLVSFLFFIQKRSVLFSYIFGVFGILFCSLIVNCVTPRHMGHLFILLIACWWVMYSKIPHWGNQLMKIVLLIQFILGVNAYLMDQRYIFSDGKQAAEYIRIHQLETLPILGDGQGATTVAGYLDKPIFYVRAGAWGTFQLLDNRKDSSQYTILSSAKRLSEELQKTTVLVLSHPLNDFVLKSFPHVQRLAIFRKGLEAPEWIYLYKYSYLVDIKQ